MMQMPYCGYAMMQIPINQKFSFIFQIEAFSEPETKMLLKLDLFFSKVIIFLVRLKYSVHHSCPKNTFYFYLRLPKIGDHCYKSSNGISIWDQMIWLREIYFHNLIRKGVAHFQSLFLETRILWKSNILKDSFFFSEYGNLTSIKTHRDRLRNLGKTFLNRKFKFSGFERDWRFRGGFRCFLVVNPSFFCLLHPWVLGIFSFSL